MEFSQDQKDRILELYEQQKSVDEIATSIGVSYTSIYGFFAESGITTLKRLHTKYLYDTSYRMFLDGCRNSDIARKVKRSTSCVSITIGKYRKGLLVLDDENILTQPIVVPLTKQQILKASEKCEMCEILAKNTVGWRFSTFCLCTDCIHTVLNFGHPDMAKMTEEQIIEVRNTRQAYILDKALSNFKVG